MVSDLGVDLLPLPEDIVDHGVVHVEEGFWDDGQQKGLDDWGRGAGIEQRTSRAVGGVSGLAEHASDTEVTAGMDGGREPVRLAFHLSIEAGEVGLVEDFLDLYWVGVVVQDSWGTWSVKNAF